MFFLYNIDTVNVITNLCMHVCMFFQCVLQNEMPHWGYQLLYSAVSVILHSFDDLCTLHREIKSNHTFGADLRVEGTGLLWSMSEPSFKFIAEMVHKILSYLDPPNKMLQHQHFFHLRT